MEHGETVHFGKAERIELLRADSRPMRAFHLSWVSFCVAFFAWFALAPLMPVVREDLGLSAADVSNAMLASVAVTIVARVLVGFLCDQFGPRRVYTVLLLLSAAPVVAAALAASPTAFIAARFAIGVAGASFVVTQYHMSLMFAARVLGTANALTAGWGNLGGGLAQVVMPLLFAVALSCGMSQSQAWRAALLLPAGLLVLCSFMYWRWTVDTPSGNWPDNKEHVPGSSGLSIRFLRSAAADIRTWVLALAYAVCFGVELTMHNVAPLYFVDRFELSLQQAGALAAIVGLANIFARAVGGFASDQIASRWGLHGRVFLLFVVLFIEGVALALFGRATTLSAAIAALTVFALFVNFATGATFGVVPFLHRRAVGSVSGIVAAGGNIGAVLAALVFRGETDFGGGLFLLGCAVAALAPLVLLVRFSAIEQQGYAKEAQRSSGWSGAVVQENAPAR
ncbi:MAG: nitrate transporter [Candidatus Binatia bacterium]|nr:MAG: nitrate transporter [Candidatus Binatia bacterium]